MQQYAWAIKYDDMTNDDWRIKYVREVKFRLVCAFICQ